MTKRRLPSIAPWSNKKKTWVTLHEVGMMTDANTAGGNRRPVGGPRGKIKGWTPASRRRFRKWLITHRPMDGRGTYNVTLTIPGPPLRQDEWKSIWLSWHEQCKYRGWGCAWRIQIQRRGQPHWHCLMSVDDSEWSADTRTVRLAHSDYRRKEIMVPIAVARVRELILESWRTAVDSIGPRSYEPPIPCGDGNMLINSVPGLSRWRGFEKGQDVQGGHDGEFRWLRYLMQHASRQDKKQEGVEIGRHWGVLERKYFDESDVLGSCELTRAQLADVLRMVRKHQRRRLRCAGDPRGYRMTKMRCRGHWGKAVWFGNPEDFRRMVELVKQNHPEGKSA